MESHTPSLQIMAPAPPVGSRPAGAGPAEAKGAAEDRGFANALAGCQPASAAGAAAGDGGATETAANPEESAEERRSRSSPLRGKTLPDSGAKLPPGVPWLWPAISGAAPGLAPDVTSASTAGTLSAMTPEATPGMMPAATPWVSAADASPVATGGARGNAPGSPGSELSRWESWPATGGMASTDDAPDSLKTAMEGALALSTRRGTTTPTLSLAVDEGVSAPPGGSGSATTALALRLTTGPGAGVGAAAVALPLDPASATASALAASNTAGVVGSQVASNGASHVSSPVANAGADVRVGVTSGVMSGVTAGVGADAASEGGAGGDAAGNSDASADGAGRPSASALADTPGSASALWNAGQAAMTKGSAFAVASGNVTVPVGSPQFADALADEVQIVVDPALGNGLRSATLKLNPEHLGPVEVRVRVHEQQASVAFTAQHAAAREALEAALPRLRDSLMQQGFVQVNLDVGGHGAGLAQQGYQQGAAAQSDSQRSFASFGTSSSSEETVEALRPRRTGTRVRATGGFDGYA